MITDEITARFIEAFEDAPIALGKHARVKAALEAIEPGLLAQGMEMAADVAGDIANDNSAMPANWVSGVVDCELAIRAVAKERANAQS